MSTSKHYVFHIPRKSVFMGREMMDGPMPSLTALKTAPRESREARPRSSRGAALGEENGRHVALATPKRQKASSTPGTFFSV